MNIATVLTLVSKLWLVKPATSGLHSRCQDFWRLYYCASAGRRLFYFVAHTINVWSCIDQRKTRLVT
jgi:hypothetical protein